MENKCKKDFYHSLSKKELQELCRRYGLSPYMTKPNLVNSLYSYLKKKNFSPISPVESSSVRSASLISPVECGSQPYNVAHAPKDSYWNINCRREKVNRKYHSLNVKRNGKRKSMGAQSYKKASGLKTVRDSEYPVYDVGENLSLTYKNRGTYFSPNELGCNEDSFCKEKSLKFSIDSRNLSFAREVGVSDAPQIRSRNLNHVACLAENASTSSIKSSKAIPSFEFYVRSEDGVNLIVDLNTSPSDWSKRLENEVCGCDNMLDNKFGSLRDELQLLGNSNKEIENSHLWNTDSMHKMNNGPVQAESSSVKRDCDPIVVDHPYGGDGTLRCSPLKSCHAAMEMSTQLEADKELLLLSPPNSVVRNHVTSGSDYGPIDRVPIPVDSKIKSSSNSVVNSTPGGPESLNWLAHQNLEIGDKNSVDLTLQNTGTHVSPSLVYPGSSSTGSMELQSSDVVSQQKAASCSPCRTDNLLDVVDPMLNVDTRDDELAYSSTCQDLVPACPDEWERSKVIDGAEKSECLQFTKEKEADKVLKRKKRHCEGGYLNRCDEHNARILRSRKHLIERVLHRRSTRLVPK